MKKFNRVFLVGFRTTGKSTLGKLLADKLNWSFIDLDFLISHQEGGDIGKLTKNGIDWAKFREVENEALKDILVIENAVISCGGGVGVNDVIEPTSLKTYGDLNRQILKSSKDSLIILLQASEEIIEDRLRKQYKNKEIMPFLNPTQALDIKKLEFDDLVEKQVKDSMVALEKRKPLYEKLTDIKIETTNVSNEKIVKEILKYVR